MTSTDRRPGESIPRFMAHAGLGEPPGQEPGAPDPELTPEQLATARAASKVFLAHLLRPTTSYLPNIEALHAATPASWSPSAPPPRASSARSALALADQLGTPATEFPGDHAGFATQPEPFEQALHYLLTQPT